MNKEGEKKPEKKEKRKQVPPLQKSKLKNQVNPIIIHQTKYTPDDKEELIDNYQYHETKDLKKGNKHNLVTHRRLCEPFYSLVHHGRKKYSSYTEQPRTLNNSFKRNEYEIIESRRPMKQDNNIKFNYKTETIYGQNQNKYISSTKDTHSTQYYNYTNKNSRNNSFIRKEQNEHIRRNPYIRNEQKVQIGKNSHMNQRKDYSEERKRNNSIHILEQNRNIYQSNYISSDKKKYNQNYDNIKMHEIKVTSSDKKIKSNYNQGSNKIERKRYVPRQTKNNQISKNYNITNRQVKETKIKEINSRTNNIYNSSNIRNNIDIYENNRNYYPYEVIKQKKQIYEIKRAINIPQHMEQIAIYENGTQNISNIPSRIQIDMHEKSQNIPQQIQEIEVHEIKENIPQHVQQIEVHENNDNNGNFQNYEERTEQEIYQENQVERESKEIEENENKNINVEQNNQQVEEIKNQKNNEEDKKEINNNEQIEKNEEEEKEENIEIQNMEQMEEKGGNINQGEQFEMQQIEYRQYIPQENFRHYLPKENVIENDEIYQINRRQNIEKFNNEQNFININSCYCPIHGFHNNLCDPNFIYNVNQQYNDNYLYMNQNTYNLNSLIGEDGMVGNTNNYKFYESKNIRNKGDINSTTFHHLRGSETNLNKNSSFNKYIATKVRPIVSETNYQQYQMDNSLNKIEQSHFHTEHGNCPIHGKKFFQKNKNSE